MTDQPDIDPTIHAWLADHAPHYAPDDVLTGALTRVSRLRRRPAWRIPERWIPMRIAVALAVIPRAVLIILVLALTAGAAAAVVVASQPSTRPLPPAMGVARNGLLAYDSHGDIWTMRPDGSDQRQLTSGSERDISPLWSRDGTLIAFWSFPPDPAVADGYSQPSYESGDASLVVMRADGFDRRVIADGVAFVAYDLEFSWSPDGRQLAYIDGVSAAGWVTVVSLDGAAPQRLAQGETPRWAPDGSLIAYRRVTDPAAVMVVAPDGGEPRRLTTVPGSGGAFYMSNWSPDGRSVVFYASSDGFHDIWVVNADGTGERQLTTNSDDEYWPAWSPAGDRISFSRVVGDPQNRPRMVTIGADGTNERVLSDEVMMIGANSYWSPDGKICSRGAYDADGTYTIKLFDTVGSVPIVNLPIADNIGFIGWQRLAP